MKTAQSSQWEAEERRRFLRVAHGLQVSCRPVVGEGVATESKDISATGIQVIHRKPLPVGAEVEVNVKAEAQGIDLTFPGVVRRCDRTSSAERHIVGVEFLRLLPDQRENILRLIAQLGPAYPDRERRRYVRWHRPFAIWYRRSLFSRWRPAVTENIGCGGLMFKDFTTIRHGQRLRLRIELSREETIRAEGRVVHIERGGRREPSRVHVAFVDPHGDFQRRIGARISREITEMLREPRKEQSEGHG